MEFNPPQVPVRITTSKPPVRELRRKSKLLAPDSEAAFTISPSGSFTFDAAVI